MRPIDLYWHGGGKAGAYNFGDALSPLIVEAASGRPVRFAARPFAEAVAIGSILEGMAKETLNRRLLLRFRPVLVLGAGCIAEGRAFAPGLFRAPLLRGPKTRPRVPGAEAAPMADPGLFASELLRARPARRGGWAIAPHIAHKSAPIFAKIIERTPNAVLLDLNAPPEETLAAMAGCDAVASSSLHGLVAADSLGLPSLRIRMGSALIGGDFKFEDYAGGLGRALTTVDEADLTGDLGRDAPIDSLPTDHLGRVDAKRELIASVCRAEL